LNKRLPRISSWEQEPRDIVTFSQGLGVWDKEEEPELVIFSEWSINRGEGKVLKLTVSK
jgi:hypothetical protein